MVQSRNTAVDIAMFLVAIFVIGIHSWPLSEVSAFADFASADILFRTVVPFFAVCTGYFLSKKNNKGQIPFIRTVSRIFLLYVGWYFFYLLILSFSWSKSGAFSCDSYIVWSKSFLIGRSYYHLWYLAQLFWALVLFIPIVRHLPEKYYVILTVILWMLGSFDYVYSDILDIGGRFVRMYDYFGEITGSVGRMLPLLLTGNIIAGKEYHSQKCVAMDSCLCFLGLIAEVFILRHLGAERFSYVLFTLPLAYFLFILIKNAKVDVGFNSRLMSKSAMNIYLLHPAVLVILKELDVTNPLILFCLCVIFTTSICFAFTFMVSSRKTVPAR